MDLLVSRVQTLGPAAVGKRHAVVVVEPCLSSTGRPGQPPGAVTTTAMPSPDLTSEIKALLVAELNLNGRDPSAIPDDAPLFGEGGLGLDSLDALQIAMLVEERFGIRVPEGDEARPIFRSVAALGDFIERRREQASSPREEP